MTTGFWQDGQKAPRRGTLARAVEQREVKRREQEAVRTEIDKFYSEQKFHNSTALDPFKEDVSRKMREAKERAQEAQMLDSLYQTERSRELALVRAEEEEKLTTALARREHDRERKEKEIQHLKAQSVELRELAEKINAARVNKERAMQLQEKAQIQAQHKEYETQFHQYLEATDAAAAAREAEHQARRREQAVRARQVLEEQMEERQDMLKLAGLEAARERSMVDEVVRRIMDEDALAASLKRQRVDETKAFIAQFLQDQEDAKRAKKAADREEDKKIQDYWQKVRDRESEEAAKLAARKQAADHMYEMIRKEMEEQRRVKEREEELINLLRQEEAEEKRRQDDEERKRRAEELRREIQQANEYQMRLKEEREAAQRAEEEDFRRQMLAKFAEDDRIEQMNAQKRRMKQVEHAREVQRMIDDRRRMYEEQKAREEAENAQQAAEEDRKRGIVEEQRKQLLREAAELKDYLPRGVIRDQADLDFINQHLTTMSLQGSQGR